MSKTFYSLIWILAVCLNLLLFLSPSALSKKIRVHKNGYGSGYKSNANHGYSSMHRTTKKGNRRLFGFLGHKKGLENPKKVKSKKVDKHSKKDPDQFNLTNFGDDKSEQK